MFVRFFLSNSLRRCDFFGPNCVIRAILTIFRSFEDFYWFRLPLFFGAYISDPALAPDHEDDHDQDFKAESHAELVMQGSAYQEQHAQPQAKANQHQETDDKAILGRDCPKKHITFEACFLCVSQTVKFRLSLLVF